MTCAVLSKVTKLPHDRSLVAKYCNFNVDHSVFFAAPLACNSNFFPFHGGCFSINKKYSITWKYALSQCNRVGGTLAKISREGLRYALSKLLEQQKPVLYNLHIGLTSRDDWVWIDGSPLNASFWMPGYPTVFSAIQNCAVLSAGSSTLQNIDCRYAMYPLCQKESGRLQ